MCVSDFPFGSGFKEKPKGKPPISGVLYFLGVPLFWGYEVPPLLGFSIF